MGCYLEMRSRLEGPEKRDVVENRRNSGQEVGHSLIGSSWLVQIDHAPELGQARLFHVERLAISWPGLRGFHVEQTASLPVPPNPHTIALNLPLKELFNFCHTD
jgi:hypothetical protein